MLTTDWRNRIHCDPAVHHGEPCIRGTRIAVLVIVSSLADLTIDDLLREYPQLIREDVQAAIQFAAESDKVSSRVPRVSWGVFDTPIPRARASLGAAVHV